MATAKRKPKINTDNPVIKQAFDRLVAVGTDTLLAKLPVESGHGHEAFISGIEKALPGPATEGILSRYDQDRSRDPTATKAASGRFKRTKTLLDFRVSVKLPFLLTVDKGGTIKVTGYKTKGTGTKVEGKNTIGVLYARRFNFKHGRQGVLMWEQGGVKHFARVRNVAPAGFMSAAYQAIKNKASS